MSGRRVKGISHTRTRERKLAKQVRIGFRACTINEVIFIFGQNITRSRKIIIVMVITRQREGGWSRSTRRGGFGFGNPVLAAAAGGAGRSHTVSRTKM